jgi:hypothetical protein
MRHHNAETIGFTARRKALTRPAARRMVSVGLLIGLVASALSGCVVVPAGGYDHHGYYRQPYYGRHPYYGPHYYYWG